MFADLKIARKLLVAFVVIIIAFVATAGFIVTSLSKADRATMRERNSRAAAGAARALANSFVIEQNAVRGFVISQNEKLLSDLVAQRAQYEVDLAQFRAFEANPALLKRMAAVDDLVREWRVRSADRQVTLARDPATRASAAALVNGQYATKIKAGLDELLVAGGQNADRSGAEQGRASAKVNWALAVSGVVVLALSGLMLWLLTRSIARPVTAMTSAMQRLAAGNTEVAVPAQGRRDELGQMAGALAVFRDAAIEQRRLAEETAEVRRRADGDRELQDRQRAELAAIQGEVVARLGSGLARLSSGDLTARLEEAFAPEYEKVRADFNAALQELQSAMQVILGHTAGLRSGTEEINQAADDLARRTKQQAASLEETAAALGEITSAVRKTAEGAERARATVMAARSDAERSGTVVQNAVAAMGEIDRSARQISQIIGVIDEIAFQTNLLALNAGVEAARAGDAGRGFAVVASEVRALAQRSANAAKEIKSLISASTQLVDRGVGLVDETGRSLARIVAQVAGISDIVAEIASSATMQATGLAEVNGAITQMDQVTQQNAAMVEQSTAASRGLAQEAAELARSTARFRIEPAGHDRGRAQPIRADVPRAPHRALASVHPVQGATALTLQPAGAHDWEEF